MFSSVTPFAFGENLVRTALDENGEPWFVARDVCRILELGNPTEAIRSLDDDEKADLRISEVSSNGIEQQRTVRIIPESGLYALVFRSRKPEARAFSKLVRVDVLPALRKTGICKLSRERQCLEPGVLPHPLPPEVLGLRPAMRQKLWENALQTARLDGTDARAVRQWFFALCRMVSAQPPAPVSAQDKVRAFFHQCCEPADGCRIQAKVLYEAFRRWHRNQRGDLPSLKLFGTCMREFVRCRHSNGSQYEHIRLKDI